MNLNLEQLRAMVDLFADAEAMVELYWDTDNGERLSRSLERARTAFPRLREELHELTCRTQSPEFPRAARQGATMSDSSASAETGVTTEHSGRLVIDAECTTCGYVCNEGTDGISTVGLALAHTAATGHVVILNGTTDLLDADNPSLSATPSADK